MNILQQDIIKLIYKKNYLKLKQLDSYFGDHNYIIYLENLFTFEEYLDNSLSNNLINRNIIIYNIKLLKKEKLSNIATIKNNLQKYLSLSKDKLIETFKENFQDAIKLLNDNYCSYKKLINFYLSKIYNLQIIDDIYKTIDLINAKYLIIYKNLINQQTFLQPNTNVKRFLLKFAKDLIKKFNDEYKKIVFLIETTTDFKVKDLLRTNKFEALLDKRKSRSTVTSTMAETKHLHASSIELRQHLNDEIQKHQSLLEIKQSELNELRHLLEIESKTSLLKQRLTATKFLKGKEEDLKMRLRALNDLETNIISMRTELHRIESIQKEKENELNVKKNEIKEKIREIIKLEKLIEDISDKMIMSRKSFNEQSLEYNRKKNEILNDPSLTKEERQKKLDQLSLQFNEYKKNYLEKLSVLQEEFDDLQTLSNIEANNTRLLLDNLKLRFKNELEQLEQMKIGATSSELIEINRKVLDLQMEYDKETKELTKAQKTFNDYKNDELGRFFMDINGRKIYQRESNASQYVYENNQWVKICDGETVINVQNNLDQCQEYELTPIERQRIQDQEYIKTNLGEPLKLGLAAITINQPTDPINYLANFLLQYRYTTLNNIAKNQEFQDLMNERQRVSDEMARNKKEKEKAKPKEDFQDYDPCTKYAEIFDDYNDNEEIDLDNCDC